MSRPASSSVIQRRLNGRPVASFESVEVERKDGGSKEPPVVVVVVTERVFNKALDFVDR